MNLARIAIFATVMPKLECKSLELESHCIFIMHSLENLGKLCPKTNDNRGSPQSLSGETITAGLYLFHVSIRYKLFEIFPQLAYAHNWHTDKVRVTLKNNFHNMTLMETK